MNFIGIKCKANIENSSIEHEIFFVHDFIEKRKSNYTNMYVAKDKIAQLEYYCDARNIPFYYYEANQQIYIAKTYSILFEIIRKI